MPRPEAKNIWGDTGDLEPADGAAGIAESVATIEFAKSGDGTALTVTEQGAYLDGIDGPQAPSLRREGVTEMLDNLTTYLRAQGTP